MKTESFGPAPVLNVVSSVPSELNRAIAFFGHALGHAADRNLTHVTLRRAQHVDPLPDELGGRQRLVARALEPDELGDVLEVLSEDVVSPLCDHRHVADAQREQLLPPAGILQHVDHDVVYASPRKKLFRPETAASPGLGEEDELFGCAHGRPFK